MAARNRNASVTAPPTLSSSGGWTPGTPGPSQSLQRNGAPAQQRLRTRSSLSSGRGDPRAIQAYAQGQSEGLRAFQPRTTSLRAVDGKTEVSVLCDNLPEGIRPEDNEEGSRQALVRLARLVEG